MKLLADIGVILLMYSIGLEFSFRELLRVRWVAGVGTPLAMLQHGATHVVQPRNRSLSHPGIERAAVSVNLSGVNAQAYTEMLRAGLENYAGVLGANANFPALEEVKVGHFSGDGETLGEAHARERYGVTVVAILTESGAVIINPPATASIRASDTLRVFGLPTQIADLASYVRTAASDQRAGFEQT